MPRAREQGRPVPHRQSQAGAAFVATVVMILVLAVLGVSFTSLSGAAQIGFVQSGQSIQALYAAESGIAISIKELAAATDVDGNGTIGARASTTFNSVTVVTTYAANTITSTGSTGAGKRVISITAQ